MIRYWNTAGTKRWSNKYFCNLTLLLYLSKSTANRMLSNFENKKSISLWTLQFSKQPLLINYVISAIYVQCKRYNDSHVFRSSSLICNCSKRSQLKDFSSQKLSWRDCTCARVEALWTSELYDKFNNMQASWNLLWRFIKQ